MTRVIQMILHLSFAILAFTIAVAGPDFLALSQTISLGSGLLFYVISSQATTLYFAKREQDEQDIKLEKIAFALVTAENKIDELFSKSSEGADNSKMVNELKMLQTLLLQFVQKEKQLSKRPVVATGKDISGAGGASGKGAEDKKSPMDPATMEAYKAKRAQMASKAKAEAQKKILREKSGASGEDDDAPDLDTLLSPDLNKGGFGQKEESEEEEIIELSESEIFDDELSGGKNDERRAPSGPGILEDFAGDNKTTQGSDKETNARAKRQFKKRKIRIIKRESQLLDVMRSGLSENRVDLYLQPIVGLPARKATFFECFSRVRDEEGNIILPRHYIKLAETAGLSGTLDNLLLFRLIQLIRRMGKRKANLKFFTNLSLASLQDKEFFPQFVDYMTMNEEFSNRLVFEISKEDFAQLPENVLAIMSKMGKKGFSFSLDHVDTIDLDVDTLKQYNVRYVKIDHKILETSFEENGLRDFVAYLRRNQIALISSRVEREAMVLHALENDIEFAQGYLFSEPVAATEMDQIL